MFDPLTNLELWYPDHIVRHADHFGPEHRPFIECMMFAIRYREACRQIRLKDEFAEERFQSDPED